MPSAVEEQILNHQTSREVQDTCFLIAVVHVTYHGTQKLEKYLFNENKPVTVYNMNGDVGI